MAAILATIYFYKYRHTPLKYLLYLLWYITFTEFLAWYSVKYEIKQLLFINEQGVKYNWWMYNLLRFVTFNGLFLIYSNYLKNKKFKQLIKLFVASYTLVYILNWTFIQNFIWDTSEIPRIVGSIFLIITILCYFIELLRSDLIVVFHKLLMFWISVGLLLFYTGTIPFFLKINQYAVMYPFTDRIHKLFLIIYILAITMYLTFSFGFIWSKKEKA